MSFAHCYFRVSVSIIFCLSLSVSSFICLVLCSIFCHCKDLWQVWMQKLNEKSESFLVHNSLHYNRQSLESILIPTQSFIFPFISKFFTVAMPFPTMLSLLITIVSIIHRVLLYSLVSN